MTDVATFMVSGGVKIPPDQKTKDKRTKYAHKIAHGFLALASQIDTNCTSNESGLHLADLNEQMIHFDLEISASQATAHEIIQKFTKAFGSSQNRSYFYYLTIYDQDHVKHDLIKI